MYSLTPLIIAVLVVIGSAQPQIVKHYDHIIIGAGIGGIAASLTLSDATSQHLLIEARDRIGGRVKPISFSGVTQDEGASYLHYPYDGNLLHTMAERLNIGQIPAKFDNEAVYYAGNKSLCSASDLQAADEAYGTLMDFIYDQV